MAFKRLVSTRGLAVPCSFKDAVVRGLADDGGLYTLDLEDFPTIDLALVRGRSYPEVAALICHAFAPEISFSEWLELAQDAYSAANFDTRDVAPITWLESGFGVYELWHGNTLAFKDLSLQLLARLMEKVLAERGERTTVAVATSGDTGGAAVEAFRGRKGTDLFVLYPKGRVSPEQRIMMTTGNGENVHALEVDGVFDDCQARLKDMFNDKVFRQRVNLSGVNSINWARIVAQVVYWTWGYLQAGLQPGQVLTVVIPSGNFGNALAAYLTKRGGVPLNIIVATNTNYVLHDFFGVSWGIYRVRPSGEIVPTTSPSMDIGVASNFERPMYYLFGAARVRELWELLAKEGSFTLTPEEYHRVGELGIHSGMANEHEVFEAIRVAYKYDNYMIDTHTAVGVHVGLQYRDPRQPMLVASTAHASKTADAVEQALGKGRRPKLPERWAALLGGPERIVSLPNNTEAIKRAILSRVA